MKYAVALLVACLIPSPALADTPGAFPEHSGPASTPAPASAPASQPAATTLVYETVVTGKKPIARDRTQSATLVEGKRLRESARASTFEALSQETADLYVSGRGVGPHGVGNGATGAIHIRGLGGSPNSQILVVEDGVPDYQGIFGHPLPDAYVPFLIDQVLVVKGGDSVLYGTNALGGAVVIRNRWRHRPGFEVVNDSAFGSYSTLRESASVLGRWGAWDAAAAFQALKTDGHRQGTGGSNLVGTVGVRYRLGSGLALTVKNKVVHVEGADPGPASHPTPDHWFDAWRDNTSLQLALRKERLRLTLTPYLNAGVHRLYDGFYSRDFIAGATGEAELRLHQRLDLLVGLAGEEVFGDVQNRVTSERPDVPSFGDASAYSQVTLKPVTTVALVLGARPLFSTKYGFSFLYKAGGHWNIYRGLRLHTRLARNLRQPTMRELHLPYPTANPNLKPELALNWDFGLDYIAEHFELSCSLYRTDARDLIKYFGVWPAAEVVNIDHLVIWGIEGRVGVKRLGPVSAFVSGNWQDVGRYTRQNPSAKINITVDGAVPVGRQLFGASLTGEWVHGLFMADYGRQPIPDAFVMDLALRYGRTLGGRGLQIKPYLLLRNFLDRRYAYVEGYSMPGFNALFGLKLGT